MLGHAHAANVAGSAYSGPVTCFEKTPPRHAGEEERPEFNALVPTFQVAGQGGRWESVEVGAIEYDD